MSMFEDSYDKILSHFSDWIQVVDSSSKWTIEDFPYDKGVDELQTFPHCWKCVTVNKCWFKNEGGKKPQTMSYDGGYGVYPKSKRGLYHLNCHCEERAINVPRLKDINILLDNRKVTYFYEDKLGLFHSLGYKNSNKDEFIKHFKEIVKDSYRRGNYELEKHLKTGYQINLFVELKGQREKKERTYKLKSAFIVFPQGTLRCVTLIGGWS